MSLYDGPRDVSEHLTELESRFGCTGYDHRNGKLMGWRAERQIAHIRESDIANRRVSQKSKVLSWLSARLPAFWRMNRQAN